MGQKRHHTKNYVLITGASSGIGACFARRFWAEGYSLILAARRTDRLMTLKSELYHKSGTTIAADKTRTVGSDQNGEDAFKHDPHKQKIIVIPADLSRTENVKSLFEKIEDIRLSIFINNAGFGDCGFFCDTDAAKDLDMIDVNVKAMHLAMKLALLKMTNQGGGFILNVASSAGLLPGGPYMATYYATKAYVASLTRAVACELKERGSSVYVGALCPGPVDTEFNSRANVEFALKGISAEMCVDCAIGGMKKKKTIIIPTLSMKLAIVFGRLLPQSLLVRIAAHQQRKKIKR